MRTDLDAAIAANTFLIIECKSFFFERDRFCRAVLPAFAACFAQAVVDDGSLYEMSSHESVKLWRSKDDGGDGREFEILN